jgi:hypothetical protein
MLTADTNEHLFTFEHPGKDFLDCWNKGLTDSRGKTIVGKVFTIGQTTTFVGVSVRLADG